MTWDRKDRQEAILREKIAVIVLERLSDPRLGFVTITGAKLNKDKRVCTVTYTVLGSDTDRRKTARALADACPRIQELLGPTLRMRSMPTVRFVYDETVERESRMLGILGELAAERAERGDVDEISEGDDDSETDAEGDDADEAPGEEPLGAPPERGP
jgi:ribosome-binding factor A